MRSSAAAILIDDRMTRRSTAIGWRSARSFTVCSWTATSRASTRASSAITCSATSVSCSRSATKDRASWLSARPPISLIVALSRSSSSSKRFSVCSAIFLLQSLAASAEAAGDIGLCALVPRRREDRFRRAELDQLAQIHEGGEVRDARRLLHVVGDDDDRVFLLQLVDQLLDLGGRDRIERRARLVEQNHFGLHRHGAGDAEPLLLAARQAEAVGRELVLDLVPQSSAAQRLLDPAVDLGARQALVEPYAEGDIFIDRHRKRRRLLEHHADAGAQQVDVLVGAQEVVAIEQHLAGGALAGIEVVHAVEHAEQRRLAAARRADESRRLVGIERQA